MQLFSAYTPKRVPAVRPPPPQRQRRPRRRGPRSWWPNRNGRRVLAVGLALALGAICLAAPVHAKPLCDALGKVTLAELLKLLVGG